MINRFLTALTLLVVPYLALAQATPKQSPQLGPGDVYKMASPAVVLIEIYGEDGKVSGTGSGFLISADGRILTNFHVIAHSKRATVRLENEDAYDSVEVIDVDKRKDIALLKIKAVGQPFLQMGRSNAVQVGDKLYTLGNPLGVFQNSLSDGILSGIRQMDGYKLFQLSAPISQGSSGSPVFNSSGQVIAIVESTLSEGQNLNFAIPIDYAIGMLDSKETHPLESVYEPEEPKKANEPKSSSSDTKSAPNLQPTSAPNPSQTMKADPYVYLSTKIRIWTKEDAELELGLPVDRRDGLTGNSVTADIYKYNIPYSGIATIELNIDRNTKKVVAAYFYYRNSVSWEQIRKILGKNYKKQKLPNGRPFYLYQFGNRQVGVIVDSADNVYNFGVW
jgi:Trypsin-like peptidase domain